MIKNKIWSKDKTIMFLPIVNMFNVAVLLFFSIYVSFLEKNFRIVYIPTVLVVISYFAKKAMLKHLWIMQSIYGYQKLTDITKSKNIKLFIVWGVFFLLGVFASVTILVKSNVEITNIEVVHTIVSVFCYAIFIGTIISGIIFMAGFGASLSINRTLITKENTCENKINLPVPIIPVGHQHNTTMSDDSTLLFEKPTINPANGLPMADSTTDIHGDLYGFSSHSHSHIDINPASGLSMANSSIDVHGNVYGSSMSHDFVHHNHHHDIHSSQDIHSHHDHYNSHS